MADYAVVVGVAQYPELSAAGIASDLDGPNNDATAVVEWLLDPGGGGLPPGNVKVIRSCDYVPPDPYDPQPAEAEVERALRWVEAQTRNASGHRLYLYFSGHGFSPVAQEGALFTAEATQVSMSYVYAHGWLKWFRTAQRFEEFVLWMDCCMNYQQSIPVRPVNMRPQIGTGTPGPEFVATAAETKSAIEGKMTDGLVHGVFTWTLLQGLRGGAADYRGRVTAEGLKNFLHTVMPEFLPEPVKAANSVDLQASVRTGGDILFARFPARPKYPVRLTFPAAAAGELLKIWAGSPHKPVVEAILTGAEWTGELVRGLYVAEVAAAGLRHGFQVTGTGSVTCAVSDRGNAVIEPPAEGQFTLDVVAQNAAATITVMDHNFTKIYTSTGELHERDVPGVYKVRTQIGREMGTIKEEILLLDWDTARDSMAARALPSPAPIPGSAFTHESHVRQFAEAAAGRGMFADRKAGNAQISVLSRYWTEEPLTSVPAPSLHPMQGLDIFRFDGQLLAHMAAECTFDDKSPVDRVAVWEQNVEPGVYFLRITPPSGAQLEASIVAAPSWLTQLAIKRPTPIAGQSKSSRLMPTGDAAIFMRDIWKPPGTSGQEAVRELYALASTDDRELPQAGQDAVIEAARIAFTQGRNLLGGARGTKLQKLLLEEFDDPIAGIIGGHLLLMAMDTATEPDPALEEVFAAAVARLRGLVRSWHPDVEALALRSADPAARPDKPFTAAPMFSRSWQIIVEASYDNPDLVPASLWSRVHANRSIGPYFAWATDEASRSAHAQQLGLWNAAHGPRSTRSSGRRPPAAMPNPAGTAAPRMPEALREDARRLGIPAVAAESIWRGTVSGEPGQ
ncbi:caspase domain-containing protein [Arthrobacter sp. SLBN-100]|uniref:caspase family protein n=1 Tax=Arthrobacter sp. SLBN-100 TaxID=2768450 RepID=UPI00114F5358|nr:caspase family protein [Arthrobacter sp. SLBN-100]TQJ67762.1 caspase domain-containing protein [Arthrobacter sp. SLBN-100]